MPEFNINSLLQSLGLSGQGGQGNQKTSGFYQSTGEYSNPNWTFDSIYKSAGGLGDQLMDFNSPFYQNFRSYLSSVTPQIGTNALLAPLMAQGASYGSGQAVAKEQREALEGKRQDFLNTSTRGFASQNINMLPNLLQTMLAATSRPKELALQAKGIESQEGGFLDFLAPIGGALAGGFLSGGNPLGFIGGYKAGEALGGG